MAVEKWGGETKRLVKWILSFFLPGLMLSYRQANSQKAQDAPGGRSLMEQMETCIPLTHRRAPACWLQCCRASLSFCFASLATARSGWRSNPRRVCLYMFFNAALFSNRLFLWKRKMRLFFFFLLVRNLLRRSVCSCTDNNTRQWQLFFWSPGSQWDWIHSDNTGV